MKHEDKSKDSNTEEVVEVKVTNDSKVVERSTIKRMLNTLDRFLTKRFMSIIAFCTAVISICAIGLAFANTTFGNASSSGSKGGLGGNLTLETWLWSLIAVFGFIAITTVFYVCGRKKAVK